jgi:Zn-dependent protease
VDSDSPLRRLERLEALERIEAQDRAQRLALGQPTATAASTATTAQPVQARRRGIVASVIAALAFALTKAKLLFGALKFGSLLQTFSTLAVSAWIYSGFYGPRLAIGLVLLILVHEYGHGIAAKIMGLRVGAPIFIPFFGAVIALKDQPRTTWIDAVVGFGGPLGGTVGGVLVLAVGLACKDPTWSGLLIVTAWLTFTINLFNLMPVFGLDGDRISQPFRPWYWIPGCVLVLALGLASVQSTGHWNPFMLLTLILGAIKGIRLAVKERRARAGDVHLSALERVTRTEKYVEESSVQPWQRVASACAYFALIVCLASLALWSHGLTPPVTDASR